MRRPALCIVGSLLIPHSGHATILNSLLIVADIWKERGKRIRLATKQLRARRPSGAWAATTVIAVLVALSLAFVAVRNQRISDRPIGEGELFLENATFAAATVTDSMHDGMQPDPAIRHLRNELTVEALAIVDASGSVSDSTSDSLVGTSLVNAILQFGHFDRRFVAVAAPITSEIEVDGVAEWESGDVVYQALHPLEDGSSLLMFYDISELFERRALAEGIQTSTIQLLGVAHCSSPPLRLCWAWAEPEPGGGMSNWSWNLSFCGSARPISRTTMLNSMKPLHCQRRPTGCGPSSC